MGVKSFLKYRLAPRVYHALSTRRKVRRSAAGHEPELALLPLIVDPQRAAIDVGANQGLYTYCLARLASRVIAIEPQRVFADYLGKVFPPHVSVRHVALSNKPGQVDLRVPRNLGRFSPNMATLQEVDDGVDYITEKVECATLDSLGCENVGFIKIDVEGHEQPVLEGGRQTIARDKPVMLIEVNDRTGRPRDNAVVRQVTSMGYIAFVIRHASLQHVSMLDDLRGGRNLLFFPVNASSE